MCLLYMYEYVCTYQLPFCLAVYLCVCTYCRSEQYAPDLLAQARTDEVLETLSFAASTAGVRTVLSNHNSVVTSLANVIALYDPVYRIEGLKSDDYLYAIKNALNGKVTYATSLMAKKLLGIDLKGKSSLFIADQQPNPAAAADAARGIAVPDPDGAMGQMENDVHCNLSTPEPIFPPAATAVNDENSAESGDSSDGIVAIYGSDATLSLSVAHVDTDAHQQQLDSVSAGDRIGLSDDQKEFLLDAGFTVEALDVLGACCAQGHQDNKVSAGLEKREALITDTASKLVIDRYVHGHCGSNRASSIIIT